MAEEKDKKDDLSLDADYLLHLEGFPTEISKFEIQAMEEIQSMRRPLPTDAEAALEAKLIGMTEADLETLLTGKVSDVWGEATLMLDYFREKGYFGEELIMKFCRLWIAYHTKHEKKDV